MDETYGQAAPDRPEPTVGACYKNGWQRLWQYPLELLLIVVIAILFHLPESAGPTAEDTEGTASAFLGFFSLAYTLLVSWPMGYGISFAYLKAARGDELKVKDILEVLQNYWNAVLANLLVAAIVVIGAILFIIPGIIFACKLSFVSYLIVERRMEAIEAVKESWRMTKGHALTVFLIGLLAIPLAIAGIICFGVGIIVAFMWVSLATASLYHAVSTEETPLPPQTAIGPEGAVGQS